MDGDGNKTMLADNNSISMSKMEEKEEKDRVTPDVSSALNMTMGKCVIGEDPIEKSPPPTQSVQTVNDSNGNNNDILNGVNGAEGGRESPKTIVHHIHHHTHDSMLSRSVPNLNELIRGKNIQPTQQQPTSEPNNNNNTKNITPPTPSTKTIIEEQSNTANISITLTNESTENLTLGSIGQSLLAREQQQSEQGTLVSGIRPTRTGRIFDHFLVVGLPSNQELKCTAHDEKQIHKPKVIYQYPKDQALPNDMIADFCFPNQVTSRSAQRSSSYSTLNQVAFCNLSHLLNTEHSFVFLLNTSSTLYYGVCIVKEEEVCSLPSFIPPDMYPKNEEEEKKRGLNRNHFDFIAPRVYCFLTRFPFFHLHFQMLHSILERERMLMLFSMTQSTDPSNISTMEIIDMYYSVNMESVKDKVQFKVPGHDYKTDYHCPLGSEDRLIGDWSLFTSIESLSIEDFLNVFSWVLMERSVLVVSKHLGNVSSFIYSFIPLLRPYVWQCCFIPILPDSLIESIDAPFPYLMGIAELPPHILTMKKDYLIVDIDNKKLIYPDSVPVPHLPGNKKLLETLTNHRKEAFKLQNKIPFEHLKNKFVQDIVSTFRDYHSWLVDQISAGIITCINNTIIESQTTPTQMSQSPPTGHTSPIPTLSASNSYTPLTTHSGSNSQNNSPAGGGSLTVSPLSTSPTNSNLHHSSSNNNYPPTGSINSILGSLTSSGERTPPTNNTPVITIDASTSIEMLNKQSIHFLEDNLNQVVQCLPENYRQFFTNFFHTQMFAVNAVRMMLITQERHKTSIGQIEKLESLIQLEEKSKEVLMEYQKMAKKDNKDINIIKQQLKDSEGVINELKESKKKLEMEALAMSPSKTNTSILPSFLGLTDIRKKKLEFGHRRSRSVSDQVEKNILKKSMKPPVTSFFEMPVTPGRNNLSKSQSPLSNFSTSANSVPSTSNGNPTLTELMEKESNSNNTNNNNIQDELSSNGGSDVGDIDTATMNTLVFDLK